MNETLDRGIQPAMLLDEKDHQDPIFTADGINYSTDIRDDEYYKKPHIKTWVYTNEKDFTAWVDTDGIPVPVEYNENLYTLMGGEKGVYVIKTYEFKKEQLAVMEKFLSNMGRFSIHIGEDTKKVLREKIRDMLLNRQTIRSVKFRLVNFIPRDAFYTHKNMVFGIMYAAKELDDLYLVDNYKKPEVRMYEEIKENKNTLYSSVSVDFSFYNNKDENFILDVCGGEVELTPNLDPNIDEPMVIGMVRHENTIIDTFSVYGDNLPVIGIISKHDKEKQGLTHKTLMEANDAKRLDVMMTKFKTITELRKAMMDHEISIQKLLSYLSKTEASLNAIEKEELSLFKEGVKALASFI